MDYFAYIFAELQARGKSQDKDREPTFKFFSLKYEAYVVEIESSDAKLATWTKHDSPGKARAYYDGDSFAIKYVTHRVHAETIHRTQARCIGVFDTVGSLGLPKELSFGSTKGRTLFGSPDSILGEHVERAYQALALNETRADFVAFFFMARRLRILTCR